jgi:hypothetical protein
VTDTLIEQNNYEKKNAGTFLIQERKLWVNWYQVNISGQSDRSPELTLTRLQIGYVNKNFFYFIPNYFFLF